MANLNPLNSILGFERAKHLLKRMTFKPTKTLITQFSVQNSTIALNQLTTTLVPDLMEPIAFDTASYFIPTFNHPNPIPSTLSGGMEWNAVFSWVIREAEKCDTFHYKNVMFLHSIFIIDGSAHYHFWFDYINLLIKYSDGSLKYLAKKLSRLNAMHLYLNNNVNIVGSPNENFAREFLELFTIGKGPQDGLGSYTNYTEHDVQQAARILTGFTDISYLERLNYLDNECHVPLGKKIFANHDTGNKTFSAKFGNQTIVGATNPAEMDAELDTFIDMVFAQPETAKNYARRLYRYFVRRNIDLEIETDIIEPLANNLLLTDYDLKSSIILLLSSQHFFDEDDNSNGDEIIGSKIKSPLELILFMNNQFDISTPNPHINPYNTLNFYYYHRIYGRVLTMGMEIFNPPNVAGYPAYYESPNYDKLWINSNSLIQRYNIHINQLLYDTDLINMGLFLNMPNYIKNSGDYSNPSNAITLINEFLELCFCNMPTGDRYNYFKNALLGNLSVINWQNEWNTYVATGNDNSVKVALERFVKAVVQSPEYQLF